jgi:hypothetical protein
LKSLGYGGADAARNLGKPRPLFWGNKCIYVVEHPAAVGLVCLSSFSIKSQIFSYSLFLLVHLVIFPRGSYSTP